MLLVFAVERTQFEHYQLFLLILLRSLQVTLHAAAELTCQLRLLRWGDPPAADNTVTHLLVSALVFSRDSATCEPRKKSVVLCWVCE